MAFVNIPPNLQDMFYSLSDRIAKLETGPNQAMYTAESAQGSSTQASNEAAQAATQAQAANALGIQALSEANTAIAQATISIQTANAAAAQATSAQFTAGVAQTSANGKNTSNYFTSAPTAFAANRNGTTAIAGDLWFVVSAANGNVTAQYIYNASTGWGVAPITNAVIANLDAGKITAGTITGIAYNNGSGTFSVTPAGALVASSAIITGQINATSGTFTGTVFASAGSFTGTITSANATITGGTLTVGSNFSVGSTGILFANGANITGAITATSGSFTGTITSTSGSIAGFTLTASTITNGSTMTLYNNGDFYTGGVVSSGGGLYSTAASFLGSTLSVTGQLNANGELYASQAVTAGPTASPNCYITTGGLLRKTSWSPSSSKRYKNSIIDIANVPEIDPKLLLQLPVRAFKFNDGIEHAKGDREDVMVPGFIAEEVDAIYPVAAQYVDGEIETWHDRYIIPGLLALIQDQEIRIKLLEGN